MIRIDMYRFLLFLTALFTFGGLCAQQITVTGGGKPAYSYTPEASTGLNGGVFVVYSLDQATVEFSGADDSPVSWSKFGPSGAATSTPVSGAVQNGYLSTLTLTEADCGYVIEQNGRSYYLWIIDYSQAPLVLNGASVSNDSGQCELTTLLLDGSGSRLNYYSINGAPKVLNRELSVSYMSLVWNAEALTYVQTAQSETIDNFTSTVQVTAPLCNTDFVISGDQLLNYWGREQTVSTGEYVTTAIGVTAVAEQSYREDALNEDDRHPTEYLGGSAPAEIEFQAYTTDAVTHIEWEFSDKEDFSTTIARYNDQTLRYTFRDEGVTYVLLVGSRQHRRAPPRGSQCLLARYKSGRERRVEGGLQVDCELQMLDIQQVGCTNVLSRQPRKRLGWEVSWQVCRPRSLLLCDRGKRLQRPKD